MWQISSRINLTNRERRIKEVYANITFHYKWHYKFSMNFNHLCETSTHWIKRIHLDCVTQLIRWQSWGIMEVSPMVYSKSSYYRDKRSYQILTPRSVSTEPLDTFKPGGEYRHMWTVRCVVIVSGNVLSPVHSINYTINWLCNQLERFWKVSQMVYSKSSNHTNKRGLSNINS